jgi:methyl coenzyme M reductase alpha subunit
MKQKYTISKNDDNSSITITEYSEVDKDIFAQLCAETFLIADLPTPLEDNPDGVIQVFRTRNMFPPRDYAVRIAAALADLLADDTQRILEVKIDDKAEITERRLAAEKLAAEALEEVLEDDELDTILETDNATTTLSKAEAADK